MEIAGGRGAYECQECGFTRKTGEDDKPLGFRLSAKRGFIVLCTPCFREFAELVEKQ